MVGFWEYERIPSGLKKVILRPFLKNKDKDEYAPENYRTISLLNTLFKLYEAIIHNRLVCYLEKELLLSPVQAGYRPKKSTVDHIFVLQELFLEYRFNKIGKRGGRNKKALYLCFLDLVKAFDKVSREYLFRKLYQIGISGKMLRVIQDMYTGNKATVLVDNCLTREFEIHSGVLQGSKLGPLLFLVFINDMLTDLQKSGLGAKIGNLSISCLGFADDVVLTAETPANLQLLIDKCECWAKKNLMEFNISKCKIMIFNRPALDLKFSIYDKELSVVNRYKYLGIEISNKNQTNLSPGGDPLVVPFGFPI